MDQVGTIVMVLVYMINYFTCLKIKRVANFRIILGEIKFVVPIERKRGNPSLAGPFQHLRVPLAAVKKSGDWGRKSAALGVKKHEGNVSQLSFD